MDIMDLIHFRHRLVNEILDTLFHYLLLLKKIQQLDDHKVVANAALKQNSKINPRQSKIDTETRTPAVHGHACRRRWIP